MFSIEELKVLPKRSFDSVEEFIEFTKMQKEILLDATERLHHRKKDNEEQKKFQNIEIMEKIHPDASELRIANSQQAILFLGKTVLGSIHDYKLIKTEFATTSFTLEWFKDLTVWVNLGSLGLAKDYNTKRS